MYMPKASLSHIMFMILNIPGYEIVLSMYFLAPNSGNYTQHAISFSELFQVPGAHSSLDINSDWHQLIHAFIPLPWMFTA